MYCEMEGNCQAILLLEGSLGGNCVIRTSTVCDVMNSVQYTPITVKNQLGLCQTSNYQLGLCLYDSSLIRLFDVIPISKSSHYSQIDLSLTPGWVPNVSLMSWLIYDSDTVC